MGWGPVFPEGWRCADAPFRKATSGRESCLSLLSPVSPGLDRPPGLWDRLKCCSAWSTGETRGS